MTIQMISQMALVMGLANALVVITFVLSATVIYLTEARSARLLVIAAIFGVTIGALAGNASEALVFGVLMAGGLTFPLLNRTNRRHQTA